MQAHRRGAESIPARRRPSASSTPSTSESRPADDAPESTPPPDDEPAPAPPEETSESFSVTAGELERIWPEANPADIERFTGPLNETLRRYGMDTPLRAAHFLAQVGHESGQLKWKEELWGPTEAQQEYEGREDLGNTEPGDGRRFKGRGLIQLTGRANYRKYGTHMGMNLTRGGNPEKVAQPRLAVDVAGWYFDRRVPYPKIDADDVRGVTRAVNGGLNGLDDRQAILRRAKRALSA